MSTARLAPASTERYPAASCGERWLERLELEHETLCAIECVVREGDEIVVRRERCPGAAVAGGHVPRRARPGLLLQAASAVAFFAARGFPLTAGELEASRWDGEGPAARLWIPRRSAPISEGEALPAQALAGLLHVLFARGERVTQAAARVLRDELTATDSGLRRGELWVARIVRAFPELGAPEAAAGRRRCYGVSAPALRTPASRARTAAARAVAAGREPVLFGRRGSALAPGTALPLPSPPAGLAEAVRALRRAAEASPAPPTWIAIAAEEWDAFSRTAFDSAAAALGERVEVIRIPASLPAPSTASEWRRALWVPCGALAASVRFYEAFAACLRSGSDAPRALVARILETSGWVDFVADPTGDAPLPDASPEPQRTATREGTVLPREPAARVEALLAAGRTAVALAEAERWIRSRPERRVEAWFSLAARLAAAVGGGAPGWLEAIEAEREVAGGRPREARARLDRLAAAPGAAPEWRRAARLRAAEVAALLGLHAEAARRAAAWRREHRDAPVVEAARALRLGASGLAREGRADCALGLLDEAERSEAAAERPAAERVETALARARCLSLAARFDDEDELYRRLRPVALAAGDDVAARFLAQEARARLDRRDFDGAAVRFEEALAHGGDEPSLRAELLLDLAATAYHAGDSRRSAALLERCREAAAAAGREDLGRIARGNRVELLIRSASFDEAEGDAAALEREARAERDEVRLLVALHHRGRIALRRGRLAEASRFNTEARALAGRLEDRIEIGELRLEEGDLALYAGDFEGARAAWESAASTPEDRSERRREALARLAALEARASGAPPAAEREALDRELGEDAYAAAERVARWQCLYGPDGVPEELRERAREILGGSGGAALAARVFGGSGVPHRGEAWRRLRDRLRSVLAGRDGDGRDAGDALEALGIAGLAVRDSGGRTVVAVGSSAEAGPDSDSRPLDTGAAKMWMRVSPRPPEETSAALALLLETLLFAEAPPDTGDAAPGGSDLSEAWRRLGVVTGDASMQEPYARLARFAPQSVTVLVLGESGSGKEAVARAIHGMSPRSGGPFVPVNVPAIPAALVESELFGHARGAFSGAERDRRGLLEEAAGGTIFFDEIGDLALQVQAKLLRALQEREIRRVGENRARGIDVRVVSATSRDLAHEAEAGRFREDLYYRLNVAVIRLPPLRDRGGDALRLARHFLARYARDYGKGELRLGPDAGAAIAAYPWPGNVRELQNAIAQAAALCDRDGAVALALLPEPVRPRPAAARGTGGYRVRLDAHRRDLIADALDRANGNRSRAARDLGLSRQALLYLIKELKVEVPGRKP